VLLVAELPVVNTLVVRRDPFAARIKTQREE